MPDNLVYLALFDFLPIRTYNFLSDPITQTNPNRRAPQYT